ncbi:HD domain-containing protein [Paenibacillus hamazuiensis]|uniref:HD domain-containing protein n=1 Tax=Paenibacillus hamazuiensis TaxID=2936508 RepID=UPI00200D5F56|nr:HD domain-containing protein [Paenibacillus hamazuiensis]
MREHEAEMTGIVAFIKELERLKDTHRTAWTKEGRRESVAEHTWRLSMFAFILEDYFPGVDFNKVIRICLVHDLGEAYEGDTSATIAVDQARKLRVEEDAIAKLTEPLNGSLRRKIIELWREYNDMQTVEAKIAKALDKMETIIQHNQGNNPEHFDYAFNLRYGKNLADFDTLIRTVRRIVDQDTASRLAGGKPV